MVRMWPGGEETMKGDNWLGGGSGDGRLQFQAFPEAGIVDDQTMGIYEQIGTEVAIQSFVAIYSTSIGTGETGITLLNRADAEIWNGDVGNLDSGTFP